jgi:hypothetical protein
MSKIRFLLLPPTSETSNIFDFIAFILLGYGDAFNGRVAPNGGANLAGVSSHLNREVNDICDG